ncbi:MAG: GYD domain-containing protein [Chloroflexi bacterium]|nr:GYD domain-containing protein [Chloroflexota bacterium]
MSAYISLVNFTDQGIRNVKGTIDRVAAMKKAAQAAGINVIGVWYTLGQYDMVLVAEGPDDETAMRTLLTIGMQGNVRTVSLRAFSEEEMARVIKSLP